MTARHRRLVLLIGVIAALAVAIPVMGADPSPPASPPGQTKPDKTDEPDKSPNPNEPAKADKAPEIALTVTGTVTQSTDAEGRPTFTLTAGTTTWDLSAGPPWYWGTKNPLAAYVGKSVTVVGTHREGSTDLSVDTIDGVALRAAGKPPWAGGPWVVGPSHPGWKSWMADGKPGKGHGRETAPGQNKDEAPGG